MRNPTKPTTNKRYNLPTRHIDIITSSCQRLDAAVQNFDPCICNLPAVLMKIDIFYDFSTMSVFHCEYHMRVMLQGPSKRS